MVPSLFADALQYFFGITMFLTALFLILLVLVQRGRGGGLAGALGGMGGQSAFGTKAGDTFTKVTIVVASFWILLCISAVIVLGGQRNKLGGGAPVTPMQAETPLPTERALPGTGTPDSTETGGESTVTDSENTQVPEGSQPTDGVP